MTPTPGPAFEPKVYDGLKYQVLANLTGGTVELTILPGMNHGTACDNAFTEERLDWFFQWRKTPTE